MGPLNGHRNGLIQAIDPLRLIVLISRIIRALNTNYSKNYTVLFVRNHAAETSKCGDEVIREPTLNDCKLLLMASTYFIWWYFCYIP